ncbi:hypothetical protein Dsin_002842 [Dipteronia sinensis]|uniref:RING-type E3 ubiquitin transferase n=1 Tax=Dipteronia sinensis TaxID=43782 RepID=A0AAE0EJT0_9ROSI|nr:hypothetical protein Dsin_002842 [Dipteronia sinensis]
MTILKNNHHHHQIFRVFISEHGVIYCLLLFLLALPSATAQMGSTPPPPADPFGTIGPRFDSSMAIIMVVLVSAFFLMGFFSVYIRQCAQRHFRPNNTNDPYAIFMAANNRRSRRAAARGLEPSVLNTFPTFLYSSVKGLKIGKVCLECAVCLNEFEDDETLRLIPKCSHVFHPDCIDVWLASHTTCPVCRANLVPDSEPGNISSSVNVQLFNQDSNSGQPEQRSDNIEEISPEVDHDVESADANLISENRATRSRSSGWKLTGLFPRSHSTGHLLIQCPDENCERFTLRLPEEVRSQLMKSSSSSLSRSKSSVAFTRMRSSRKGFRSASGGLGLPRNYNFYEKFRSPKEMPKSLFKSIKSKSSNSLLAGRDCDSERSFDRLRPDTQV